jgi:RNA 2',3'-cyclic 3'-phosphodiesterase
MRLFVAIDIPADVSDNLGALLDRLKPLAKLAWSPVNNLHITTKFIGEWPEARLDEMKEELAAVPVSGPIEIEIRGLGWFPNARNPRVFWAGVEAGEALRNLAHETQQAAARLGVPVGELPYSPHLTLARIRNPVPLQSLRQAVSAHESGTFGRFRASAFYLYLSAGGRYTRLKEFSLGSNQ